MIKTSQLTSTVSCSHSIIFRHRAVLAKSAGGRSTYIRSTWRRFPVVTQQHTQARGALVVTNSVSEGNASSSGAPVVYQGAYGPWTIEADDLREVYAYRIGLSLVAAATVGCSAAAFLPPDSPLAAHLSPFLDPLCLMGIAGFGTSLYFIHIYVTPLKRALQVLWAVGTIGTLYLMATQDAPAAVFVGEHRWAVWCVGPLFAALTGVAFKEGLCYGKAEAGGIFGVTPLLLLGHLSGLMSAEVEHLFLAIFVALVTVFAGRKYTQAERDDIGDKSVFMFQAMSEAEQEALIQRLKFGDK